MNRLKRFLTGVLAASIMTIVLSFQAFAARIAFSDPSANAGDEVTVNMKITATGDETINSSDVMLSYDSSALEFISGTGATGGAGSLRVVGTAETVGAKELAFSLKFKALKAGTSKITVSTQEVYDKDSQIVTIDRQGDSTVTVSGGASDSSDASLAGLQISPGNLTPAFSPDVDVYTATVGQDVDKITVSAPSSDSGATVSIEGNENLQFGENEIVCTVTAQNGQTVKTYKILVTKVEGQVDDEPVSGVALKTPERTITVLPVEQGSEIPEGYVQCSVTIDGQEVQGWIWKADAEPQYCVFYAMNENGEKDFYRYDLTEKTLQRYFRDPVNADGITMEQYAAMTEAYDSLLNDYQIRLWIIIGLIALAVILLIVIIVLVAGRGQRDDFIESRMETQPKKTGEKTGREPEKKVQRKRLSREEKYLRDLENEEEAAQEEEEAEEYQQKEAPAPKRRQEPRIEDEDDDDFEVVELK